VPFIVRYPEKIKPNTTVNALINLNDIMPTLVGNCRRTRIPHPLQFAGKSVFDLE
jgi:arylsulfatase A-like enzyme